MKPAGLKIIFTPLPGSISLFTFAADIEKLKTLTSTDPESNAHRSFIVVPADALIPEGIKHDSKQSLLAKQVPFVIELIEKTLAFQGKELIIFLRIRTSKIKSNLLKLIFDNSASDYHSDQQHTASQMLHRL